MNGISEETANPGAGAPVSEPKPTRRPRVAAHRAHVAPIRARSGHKARLAKKGPHKRDVRQVAQKGHRRPPGHQDGQGSQPAEALRRRLAEGTAKSHGLAGTLGSWVPFGRFGQEDGTGGRVHAGCGRRAPLLGEGLKASESAPFGPPGLHLGGFFYHPRSPGEPGAPGGVRPTTRKYVRLFDASTVLPTFIGRFNGSSDGFPYGFFILRAFLAMVSDAV